MIIEDTSGDADGEVKYRTASQIVSAGGGITSLSEGTGIDISSTTITLDLTEVMANSTTANAILTSDGDGTLTAESNLTFDGTDMRINTDGQIVFDGTDGGGSQGLQYVDSGGDDRYALMIDSTNVVAITNRASNGEVQIRANTATAGSGGELTKVEVKDTAIVFNDQLTFTSHTVDDPGTDESVNIGSVDGSSLPDILRIRTNDGAYDVGVQGTFTQHATSVGGPHSFDNALLIGDGGTSTGIAFAGIATQDDDLVIKRDYDDTTACKIKLESAQIEFFIASTSIEFLMQSDGDFHADGDVIANSTSVSDIRLKENLVELEPKESLEKLLSLQGYEFEWKHKDDGTHYGVIAQDLLEVLPHAVVEKKVPFYDGDSSGSDSYKEEWKKENGIEDNKYYTARYEEIIPVLIEGMKELNNKIQKLETEVEELKNGNKK